MQAKLQEKRQQYVMELRREGRERILQQKRKNYLDMTELISETESLNESEKHCHRMTKQQRLSRLIYGTFNENTTMVAEGRDSLEAIMLRSEGENLAEKCKCTSDLIALLSEGRVDVREEAFWIPLRTTVNLILRQPKIDYELTAGLLEAIAQAKSTEESLSDLETTIFMNCLEEIPTKKRTEIFDQHRKLFSFIIKLLLQQERPCIANRFILYVDTVFSGCDEDCRDLLLQNINLIKTIVFGLKISPQTIESSLITLSNIALNGSEMVELLHSFNLISNLMTVFNLSIKNSVKHLVVVVFFNLILSSNDTQIIFMCQNGLMHIIDYYLQNSNEVESLQLSLKILQKLVTFIIKRYVRSVDEADPRQVLMRSVTPNLVSLQKSHIDEFVRDVCSKILNMLGIYPSNPPDEMEVQ